MKKVVWKNKSNKQLCVTIPAGSDINEGDLVEIKKSRIRKITYSGVVLDLFHYGHLHSLQFAKSISDYNICGVLTDKAVEEYRARPIANLNERKAITSSLNCVDSVMIQHSRDPTENLKKIHEEFPDAEIILVHGSDLRYVHGSEYIKKIGGKVVQHPYYERLSTYKIISKIVENKDKFKDITDLASLIKGKSKIDSEYEKGNKIIVSTKADTLEALQPLLTKSRIEKIFSFTVSDWKNNKHQLLDKIQKEFRDKIVIRSSAVNEDSLDKSMAGSFETVLNVNSQNITKIETAIKNVVGSYKIKKSESSFNQVLVQTQTKEIVMSGVLLTRTLETDAPYYVINYDDSTGQTDTVTKGLENKTIKIFRSANLDEVPKNLQNVIIAAKEIEKKIPKLGLDIEFAVNKKNEVIIFQVRPLTTSLRFGNDDEVKDKIDLLKKRFEELSKRKQHLAAEKTFFADMPDWNPAEIIGDNPNYLDYSLYDYIITDSAWHEARTTQGYYNVNPAKLVVLFGNKPYIDVRNTFNSFVPSAVSQQLREKLVSFYLDKLEKHPELQDKVEFDVLYSCHDLSFDERSKELKEGFTKQEISELKKSLISLTNNLVTARDSIPEDLQSVKEMEKDRERIRKENRTEISVRNSLKNARFLLDDCREKGTVQFSRLARLAFIGKIILKSLVKRKIVDNDFYDSFMNSVNTVATEISQDFKLMSSGKMNKEDFIQKYYHLRPGSYDITSLRYESNPDLLETMNVRSSNVKSSAKFTLKKSDEKKITNAFKKESLKFNAKELLEFTKKALEAREYAKFEFTKNLSDALELIVDAGEEMGFTREELAMLDITSFSNQTKDRHELAKIWKKTIKSRIEEREINQKLALPPIIFSEKDFDIIKYYIPRPNYITQKMVETGLIRLDKDEQTTPEIEGKIVMIENGDPGYDWIFTRNPAGLITKYGGVASHMSIRCAEFGIPAAIGCGVIFDELINVNNVILDCSAKKITPLRG